MKAEGPEARWLRLLFIVQIPVYVFQPHSLLSASLCSPQSVTQLANGSFSPIMHCRAPLAQLLFKKRENNGVFCSQRFNFLIALPIKWKPFPDFLLWNFQTWRKNGKSNTHNEHPDALHGDPTLFNGLPRLFNQCVRARGNVLPAPPEPFEGNLQISWHFSLKNFSLSSYKTI